MLVCHVVNFFLYVLLSPFGGTIMFGLFESKQVNDKVSLAMKNEGVKGKWLLMFILISMGIAVRQ